MNNEKKNLIVFGYGLAIILTFIATKVWHDHGLVTAHMILLACVVALVTITKIRYELLKPLYKRWMKVAHFIGSVITGLILSILYYSIFGVVGIVLRLLRKDLLNRAIDPSVNTYWIPREQISFEKNHYTKQF